MGSTFSRPREIGREILRKQVWLVKQKGADASFSEAIALVFCATSDGRHSSLVKFVSPDQDAIIVPLDGLKDITLPEFADEADSQCRNMSQFGYSRLRTSSDLSPYMWQISLAPTDSKEVAFAAESQEDQRQWYNRLNLLKLYPYSPIPREPQLDLASHLPGGNLNPAKFDADYVWYSCVLAEEVGSRVTIPGIHIVALSGRTCQDGQLKIFAAMGECSLVVRWNWSAIDRAGCLDDLVFFQINKDGVGGPGLLWLYIGARDVSSFYQTVSRFIKHGDPRAYNILP